MNSWQGFSTTVAQWLRSTSSGQRWVIIAVVFIPVLVFMASRSSFWSAAHVELLNSRQLTVDEIGTMQVAFGKSGLNDYEIRGTSILIPKSERATYLKSLADHDAVPQDIASSQNDESGLGFLQSRSQQRQATLERKKQTIREMVQQLGFVQRANVDYDETRGATPFGELQRTAIVTIQTVETLVLDAANVRAIRDTVCGAVAGLRTSDVTVIDVTANRSWADDADPVKDSSLPPHAAARIQEERQYETKIRNSLLAYPGIRVNVEVAIDPVLRRVRDERTIDPNAVPVTRTFQSETSRRVPATLPTTSPREMLVVGANGQARVSEWSPDTITQFQTEVTESSSGGTFESIETAGLTVTDVCVSIGVPERCIEYLVHRQLAGSSYPGAASETVAQSRDQIAQQIFEQIRNDIRQKIRPLIPASLSEFDQESQVVVTIDPEIALDASPITIAALAGPQAAWTGWHTLGFIVFSAALAIWLRPRKREATIAPFLPQDPIMPDADVVATQATAHPEIRHQLDQWCRENPDAAASTIRQWLDRRAS